MSPKSVGAVPLGAEAGDPRLPKAGTSRFRTQIPTLYVSSSARPMTVRRTINPRPRPAAGDVETREGPGTTGVVTGSSASVVGSVWIGSESIVVMLLVWRDVPTDRTAQGRHRTLRPVGQA